MGTKTRIIVTALLLATIYLALNPAVIDRLRNATITASVEIGSHLWTNKDFAEAARNPQDHAGEHVFLDALVFNTIPNVDDKGHSVVEAYLGTLEQLRSAPYDTSRRIAIYGDGITPTSYKPGQCIHIEGTIAGTIDITTLENKVVKPVLVKADTITPIRCSQG